MFEPVFNKVDFVAQENEILKFWEDIKAFDKLRELRKNGPRWSFIDGPITANNPMGVHHAWGRTYKDLFHRYKAMRGYQTRYQNGFDCQGLWVEVNVEKDLGFNSKRDIEEYGVERFVNTCKQRVLNMAARQTEQSIRLGYWMDWNDPETLRMLARKLEEDPSQEVTVEGPNGPVTGSVEKIVGRLGQPELGGSYFTFSEENNYTIWAMLKKCHECGWIYKGTDVMPWCSRCGTGLSQHEIVTEGYQELTHTTVYLRLPLRGREGESLLVWTTTPWTLTSNVAAAVNPDLRYVLVKQDGQRMWLAEESVPTAITGSHKVTAAVQGSEMVGWTYDGPFDELEAVRQSGADTAHRVIAWEDVDPAEGTGIVHIAPGCGSEDFSLGRDYDLPVLAPLDEVGEFMDGFGPFSGCDVHDVAPAVFNSLRDKDVLYRLQDYTHRYPVCWRCGEELVFRLVDEWFISMGEPMDKPWEEVTEEEKEKNLRYQMYDAVLNETKWYPSFGLDRELDWLRNMQDWMISKKRYWGLALPIYECQSCGHVEVMGSREELKERAVEGWEEFAGHTPHRPWIDAVKIACPRCGATVERIPDVGNPWLDAGIVSMSTMRYRTDRDYWEKWFPADLISESFPGQFRNWFYSLIAMATVMERRAPFRNCFSYGTLLAEDGAEMHKSLGNAIWFEDAAQKMGVDVMRWMYASANPEQNLRFGYGKADEVRRQVLLPIWNVYSFFVTYANLDGWTVDMKDGPAEKTPLDRWILSKLQHLVETTTDRVDNYDPAGACSEVERFLDDLSNWYVRRSRRRFWRSEVDADKKAAYATLYEVLTVFTRLLAPFLPFVTEAMYQNLESRDSDVESVHLEDWPVVNEEAIDDQLEEEMALVREIVNSAHSARSARNMKVRQPLGRLLVYMAGRNQTLDKDMVALIADEINVKSVEFVQDEADLISYEVRPNFSKLGPRLGPKMKLVQQALQAEDGAAFVKQLQNESGFSLTLSDGTTVRLTADDVEIRKQEPEGLSVVTGEDVTVALDLTITPELMAEGLAREVIRRIQVLRKEAGFELNDRIQVRYQADDELAEAIESMSDLITSETLADTLVEGEPGGDHWVVKQDTIEEYQLTVGVSKS